MSSAIASADQHKQQLETLLISNLRNYVKQSKFAGNLPSFPDSFSQISPTDFRLYISALINDILIHEKLRKTLPMESDDSASMSNVFRMCEEIVETLQQLGFRSKMTFRDLMHPGEHIIREIFKWLNERLSSFDTVDGEEQRVSDISPQEHLKLALSQWKKHWSPPATYCSEHRRKRCLATPPRQVQFSNFQSISSVVNPLFHQERYSVISHNFLDIARESLLLDEWERETGGMVSKEEFRVQKVKRVNSKVRGILGQEVEKEVSVKSVDELLESQFTPTTVSESLSSLKDKFKSAFANQKFFEMSEESLGTETIKTVQETEEQIIERRQNEEKEAQDAVEKVVLMTQKLSEQIESLKLAEIQTQSSIQEQKSQKKKLQEQYKITAQTYNLFKDRDNALPEMQKISSQSAQRLIELATEWESHRVPLLQKYHKLKEELEDRKQSFKQTIDELKQKRNDVRNAIQDVKEKEQSITELKESFETLPKNLTRSDFVSRIFDIVKNIENQRIEITKILAESRELQRVIDKILEDLSGTFREAEKKIYEVAEKDSGIANVYTNVIQLRNLFESIIKSIQEKGQSITAVRDFDAQRELLSKRISENNLEQAKKDLESIKQENRNLIQELKQKKSQLYNE